MLWILASLFFLWCAFHEIRTSIVAPAGFAFPMPVSKPYLAVVLTLAVLFAWPPVHTWHFERFLSANASELATFRRKNDASLRGGFSRRTRISCTIVPDLIA